MVAGGRRRRREPPVHARPLSRPTPRAARDLRHAGRRDVPHPGRRDAHLAGGGVLVAHERPPRRRRQRGGERDGAAPAALADAADDGDPHRLQYRDGAGRRSARHARGARRTGARAAARALRHRVPGQGTGDAARRTGRADAACRGRAQARRPRRVAGHRGGDARRLPPGARVKILVLTPTFLPVVGGAELVVLEVYRRLALRHDVRLLTPVLPASLHREQGSSEYDALVTFPVEHYEDRVTLMRVRGHRWTAGALPPFSLSAVAAVRRAVAAARPDVLNVHYAMPTGLAGVVAARRLGVPTVLTMNGRDVPGPGVPALWRWWQRALIALVTDATYVSGYCRDAIYGRGRGRGEVIANGVEIPPPPGDGAAVRAALEVPPGDCLVFALQRLAPEKRVDTLLRALRRCLDGGVAVTLVIGGTGPEAPALRALAAELGIDKHVRFAGYLPRTGLGGYFEACDLFAFHSTYETFGLVVAQAMSYGRAVVTVRSTALPEVVGDAGVLVPPGDAAALGEAIAGLAHDPARRRALGEAGRRRAAALYAWDRVAEGYERVLARAAARGKAPRAG